MWYSGEHGEGGLMIRVLSLSFFIDKMVLVKTLELQGVASGSNEFTGMKPLLWAAAETGSRHKCWVWYMPQDMSISLLYRAEQRGK